MSPASVCRLFPRFAAGIAAAAISGCLFGLPANAAESDPPRPNVVILLCDDLGYGDLASYGHHHIRTPNLDQLAADGVRLTSCYAAAPVCSSSRAGLLTGRNPNRSGIYDWLPGGIPVYLRRDEPTLPALLRSADYRTAMVGKWHLNGKFNEATQPQPDDYGFEHWMATQNNASPSHAQPTNFVRNGKPVGRLEGFSCQEVADESIRWLESVAGGDQPFYLHTCFHEPHEPVASPQPLVDSYLGVAENEDEAQYFANVTNMDAAVGTILRAIDRLGVRDETLVIFTSDNGPETLNRYRSADRSYGSPGPLREMKLHLYDGGIRVPGILRWPAVLEPGQVNDTPVCGVDALPTLCELAGVEIDSEKPIDGTSLVPLFRGGRVGRERPLCWLYYRALTPPRFALREGRWKLLASWDGPLMRESPRSMMGRNINPQAIDVIKSSDLAGFELYDLDADIGESTDVSERYPDVLERLKRRAVDLHAEIRAEAPRWPETAEYWSRRN